MTPRNTPTPKGTWLAIAFLALVTVGFVAYAHGS